MFWLMRKIRIVFPLNFHQPIVVVPIGFLNSIGPFFHHEVHIGTTCTVGVQRRPIVFRPGGNLFGVRGRKLRAGYKPGRTPDRRRQRTSCRRPDRFVLPALIPSPCRIPAQILWTPVSRPKPSFGGDYRIAELEGNRLTWAVRGYRRHHPARGAKLTRLTSHGAIAHSHREPACRVQY